MKEFKCQYCNKNFDRESRLKTHLEKQTCLKNMDYICPNCNQGFNSDTKLNNHIKKSNCPKKLKCDLCGSFFRTENLLLNHFKSEHNL